MSITYLIGFLLVAWVLYDLVTGKVYLWNQYSRAEQPTAYWLTMLLWAAIATTCFLV